MKPMRSDYLIIIIKNNKKNEKPFAEHEASALH
jgi:hypothetical protein